MINREEKPYYKITAEDHPQYVAPEDAAKLILHKMKGTLNDKNMHKFRFLNEQKVSNPLMVFTETAQSALGSDITEVVITVPLEFAHAQKCALR